MRGPMRYPGPFPGDHRGPFPNEGQIPRGMHPGDPNMRHQGPRLVLRLMKSLNWDVHSTVVIVKFLIVIYLCQVPYWKSWFAIDL